MFFIASLDDTPCSFTFSALVAGRQPKLWDAETGTIIDAPAAKYFSGTATYRTTFARPSDLFGADRLLQPDLAHVHDLAHVKVNGRDLGVWRHCPFVRDVTDALRPGENKLELAITNTWHNRLVGDEREPADFGSSLFSVGNGGAPTR